MKWIGHSEFGMDYSPIVSKNLKHKNYLKINHWLEQWKYLYQDLAEPALDIVEQPVPGIIQASCSAWGSHLS